MPNVAFFYKGQWWPRKPTKEWLRGISMSDLQNYFPRKTKMTRDTELKQLIALEKAGKELNPRQ